MPTGQRLLLRLGLAGWSFIGIVGAAAIVVAGLAVISSVVLPVMFAAVLAVLFRPLAARLERRGVPPALAAGAVVLGLVAAFVAVIGVTVWGIVDQSDRVIVRVEEALAELDVDEETIADARASLEDMEPAIRSGFVNVARSGLTAIGGFAVGALLGALILYYLLKDGPTLRRTMLERAPSDRADQLDRFVSECCFIVRRYWLGRSIISGIVAAVVGLAAAVLGLPLVVTLVVVTFVGGYVPYIGAVVSGALAVVVALGASGIGAAVVMLVVVLAANLLIENLVEPAITGRTLQIHPLVVLLVTTAGGIVGGLVGLILAVPTTVIAAKAVTQLQDIVDVDTDALRDRIRQTVDPAGDEEGSSSP